MNQVKKEQIPDTEGPEKFSRQSNETDASREAEERVVNAGSVFRCVKKVGDRLKDVSFPVHQK